MRKLLALALVILPCAAGAQSADATLERAVAAYSRMKSMRAEFRQTLTNPLTGSTATVGGTILRRKPNLLSLSFDNGDRIVADGQYLWLYVPSTAPGQVVRSEGASAGSSTFDPAGDILASPRERYSVAGGGTESIGGRATHVLSLTPRVASVQFKKVKLWIDDRDASVRQLEATDGNGLTRLIVVTRLVSNPMLSRTLFKFTPPRGVRVLDQRLQAIN